MLIKRLFIVMAVIQLIASPSIAEDTSRYEGKLIVEVLPDGRDLKLIDPFNYVDKFGVNWPVPAGSVTDGASVPRVAWSIFPPFSAKYRLAAVIHDHYCVTRERPWKRTHLVFYEAMLVAGVDKIDAKTIYAAVYTFGSRWSLDGVNRGVPKFPEISIEQQQTALGEIKLWIEATNPTIEEISAKMNEMQTRKNGQVEF